MKPKSARAPDVFQVLSSAREEHGICSCTNLRDRASARRKHRSLASDALSLRGIPVVEILSESAYRLHKLTPFAHVAGTHITYPPAQPALL